MNRLEKVTIIVCEDAIGKPYLVLSSTEKGGYLGPVELKLWAENIEVIDSRRK